MTARVQFSGVNVNALANALQGMFAGVAATQVFPTAPVVSNTTYFANQSDITLAAWVDIVAVLALDSPWQFFRFVANQVSLGDPVNTNVVIQFGVGAFGSEQVIDQFGFTLVDPTGSNLDFGFMFFMSEYLLTGQRLAMRISRNTGNQVDIDTFWNIGQV